MDEIKKHEGHNLPHWDRPGWPNFATFRLADSLPSSVIKQAKDEIELEILKQEKVQGRRLSSSEIKSIRSSLSGRLEKHLDAGHGSCILGQPNHAETVQSVLLHFDQSRYRLLCWVVMPNHVHVIVETTDQYPLESIVKSWKSFSARQINRDSPREGSLWQSEYYDHLIRHGQGLLRACDYILANPSKAGLVDWPFVG